MLRSCGYSTAQPEQRSEFVLAVRKRRLVELFEDQPGPSAAA